MSALKTNLLIALSCVCFAGAVNAQTSQSNHDRHHRHRGRYFGHLVRGYHNAYYVPRYPTRYESYARGAAHLIHARAQANLVNAQAWTQAEVARAESLKNDVFTMETRLEKRRINTQSRFGHLHALAAERKARKAEHGIERLTAHLDPVPIRLLANEIDTNTGQLTWPLVLQVSHFDKARKPLDTVFAERAKSGSINPNHYLPLRNWVQRMNQEVESLTGTLPKEDIAEAQDFLRRLVEEARLPHAWSGAAEHYASK